ncbi:hypothetical protein cypCar_00019458 [Cyprinus carpio]|nr:hypothetical protein cypCar_00019458 [Cyprinus carpio]
MFEEASEVLENMLKWSLPLSLVLFLVLVCPLRAEAAHEFSVYRMQQYDLQGQTYGSRNAILNTEARTVEAEVLSRRCVMMRLADFSYEKYQKALQQSAGAVVIILPQNMSTMPQDIVQQFMELEPELLATETIVPVYFALEDEELLSIYTQTQISSSSQGSSSAAEGSSLRCGRRRSAHYCPCGSLRLFWSCSVFCLRALRKIVFSRYNLLFFLSGGGKFNYQGTKRWLEDNLDHTDSSLLQDNVAFVLCLDTLGNSDNLYLHVSKPPKEGSPQHVLLKELETVVTHQHPDLKFSMVHKKINLADDTLAWEHERFGIRRLPAFTLSHLESHRSPARHSIMDMRSVSSSLEGAGEATAGPHVDLTKLRRNTKVIAETLARVIYNLTEKGVSGDLEIFTEQMQVQEDQLASLVDWLTAQPRAAQLLDKDSSIVNTLEYYLNHYLKDVKRHLVRADKRDPEFVFYDQLKQTMNAYRVKPAIFDLLLAFCIAAYLGVLYLAIQNFGLLYSFLRRVTAPRVKQH